LLQKTRGQHDRDEEDKLEDEYDSHRVTHYRDSITQHVSHLRYTQSHAEKEPTADAKATTPMAKKEKAEPEVKAVELRFVSNLGRAIYKATIGRDPTSVDHKVRA
jgi:hypothetical protein